VLFILSPERREERENLQAKRDILLVGDNITTANFCFKLQQIQPAAAAAAASKQCNCFTKLFNAAVSWLCKNLININQPERAHEIIQCSLVVDYRLFTYLVLGKIQTAFSLFFIRNRY